MIIRQKLLSFQKQPYWYIYVGGILIVLISGIVWWQRVYLGPKHVFWSMVERSLSTSAVTTEMTESVQGQSIRQLTQFDLGASPQVRFYTKISQNGSVVATERLGTPKADYSRYLTIQSNDKTASGKPLDVSKLTNVWAKSDNTGANAAQGGGSQLIVQALLGTSLGTNPIAVGKVSADQRSDLLQEMRNSSMYKVSFADKDVKRQRVHGRLQYTYTVKVQPVPYVHVQQGFAKALGLHELDDLDPNAFSGYPEITTKVTVDAYSHQLVSVDNGQGAVQHYEAYGVPIKTTPPTKTISDTELKKRLSELQTAP